MKHVLLALALLVGSCGDSSSAPDGGDTIGCTNDPRAMMYLPNMSVTGPGNVYKFQLEQSDPAPPIKGTNTWTLKVLDNNNTPVQGLTLKVTPFMPDHGHGTNVVPTVTPNGDSYTISNLYLFMAGLWRVIIEADAASTSDAGTFFFCIQG